jgi:hypothetical protein
MAAEANNMIKPVAPTWRNALLAALPHLFFALLNILPELTSGNSPATFRILYYGLLAIVLAVFLLAWRQGWPLWSGSWAGYWLLIVANVSSIVPVLRSSELIYFVSLSALLLLAVFIFQRRPVYGLLASGPLVLFLTRLFAFELVAGGQWVMAGIWLFMALTAGAIVWRNNVREAALLAIGFHLVAGLAFTLGRSLLPYRFPGPGFGPREMPELEVLVNDFAPVTFAVIAALLALLLLHPLRQLALTGSRRTRRSHGLLLLAMLLTLGGLLTLRARPHLTSGVVPPPFVALAWTAIVVGLVLGLATAFVMGKDAWSSASDRLQGLLVPLLAALAPLVVLALPSPFAPAGHYSDRFQVQLLLSYAGLFAWILTAIMVGGRRTRQAGVKVVR